ncbi:MAG: carboxylesterase family protein, partial [Steroidobacteraceae bacterium]
VQSRWIHFARTGRPDGTPAWPAFTTGNQRLLDFTNKGPVVRKDLGKAQLDLADDLNRQTQH